MYTPTPLSLSRRAGIAYCLAALLPALALAQSPTQYAAYVANGTNESVAVIDIAANAVTDTISFAGLGTPLDVAVTPDGTRAYVLLWAKIAIVDMATRTIVETILLSGGDDYPGRIAMAPNGRFAYLFGSYNAGLWIIDVEKNAIAGSTPIPTTPDEGVSGVAFSPDGAAAYVVANSYTTDDHGEHGFVYRVDTASQTVIQLQRMEDLVEDVVVSADGRFVYVGTLESLGSIDTITGEMRVLLQGWHVGPLVASATRLYVVRCILTSNGCSAPLLSVLERATGQLIEDVVLAEWPQRMGLGPDGSSAYLTMAATGNVSVFDTANDTITSLIAVSGRPCGLTIAPAPPTRPTPAPTPVPTPRNSGIDQRVYVVSQTARTLSTIDATTRGLVSAVSLAGPALGPPLDIAVTPDGHRAYIVFDSTVLAIDTATGDVLSALKGAEPYGLIRVAVSPDGRSVYTMNDAYETVTVIDTATNAISAHITNAFDSGWWGTGSISFSPDGTLMYLGSSGPSADDLGVGVISIISTTTQEVVGRIDAGRLVQDVAIHPNGKVAYIAGEGVTVWDLVRHGTIAIIPVGVPASIALSSDGALAYATVRDPLSNQWGVAVIDTATNTQIGAIPTPANAQLGRIILSPDGALAFTTAAEPPSALIIDLTSNTVAASVPVGDGPAGIARAPVPPIVPQPTATPTPAVSTGTALCTYLTHRWNSADNVISVINPAAGVVETTVPVGSQWDDPFNGRVSDIPSGVAIAPAGGAVYVAVDSYYDGAGTVAIVDPVTAQVVDTVLVGCNPQRIAFSPDGTLAYVTNAGCDGGASSGGSVSIIDTKTHGMRGTIAVGKSAGDIAIAPDGAVAYVADPASGAVSVLDLKRGSISATIPLGAAFARLALTPDGRFLLATFDAASDAGQSGAVALIDTATNRVARTITVRADGRLGAVAISGDSSRAYLVIGAGPSICGGGVCTQSPPAVAVVDLGAWEVISTVVLNGSPGDIALSSNGDFAYVTDAQYGTVSVIDTATLTISDTITVADGPGDLAVGVVNGDCQAGIAATPLSTRTVTPTPTLIPTPTATVTPPCGAYGLDRGDCTFLALGPAAGMQGGEAELSVTLHAGNNHVAGVQNDLITYGAIAFAAVNGGPDCQVNPAIQKESAVFGFQPRDCLPGVNCQQVRAIVFALDNADAIPDGSELYRCKVIVADRMPPGSYPVSISRYAAGDPNGAPILVMAKDGTITVSPASQTKAAFAPADAPPSSAGSGGGCQVRQAEDSRVGSVLWLIPLLLLWRRQRR